MSDDATTELEEYRPGPQPRHLELTRPLFVLLVLCAVLGVAVMWLVGSARSDAKFAVRNTADLARRVTEACEADPPDIEIAELCERAERVEDDPALPAEVVGPSDVQVREAVTAYLRANPPRGAAGTPGVAGRPPSEAEVRRAVAAFCAGGRCEGDPGDPGGDGESPSAGEVAEAVSEYCDAHDGCAGPAGSAGGSGSVSAGELAAAVAGYCDARDGCSGPAGEDGADGADGEDGEDAVLPDCTWREIRVNTPSGHLTVLACVR